MFGAWGLYCDDAFIAIIEDEVLYLKADAQTRERFRAIGARPFTYTARGAERQADYYTAPDEAIEDYETLKPWAQLALAAARRAKSKSKK